MQPHPKIARYELLEVLGTGAEGVVYLARDPVIGREVALKTSTLSTADQEQRDRRMREVRAVGRLAHPNIVTIHDAGMADDRWYIVFERIEGSSLEECLRAQRRLPWQQAVTFAADLAAALDHAHSRGVVHRDLKPANVLIDKAGKAMLTDFGIARAGISISHTGDLRGTPAYMAPEYLSSQSEPSASTDVFSLGVVFYQLLTGELPFRGKTLPQVLHAILNEPFLDPRATVPTLPEGVVAICRRCLAKDPSERYPSGGELRRALLVVLGSAIEPSNVGSASPEPSSGCSRIAIPVEAHAADRPRLLSYYGLLVALFGLTVAVGSALVPWTGETGAGEVELSPGRQAAAAASSAENGESLIPRWTPESRRSTRQMPTSRIDQLWAMPEAGLSDETSRQRADRISLPIGFLSNVPRGKLRIHADGNVVLDEDFDFPRRSFLFWRSDGRGEYTVDIPEGSRWLRVDVERPGGDASSAGIDLEVERDGKLWVSFKSSSGLALWYES